MKRIMLAILIILFISILTVSSSSGEGIHDDIRLSVQMRGSFDRIRFFYGKLPDFKIENGTSVDPFFLNTNGASTSLQLNLKLKRFVIEGILNMVAEYEAFIHDEDGDLRYNYNFSGSPSQNLVITDEAINLQLSLPGKSLFIGWYFHPSLSAGIAIKQRVYQFAVERSGHPLGLFAKDSTKAISLGSDNYISLAGVRMNYERQFKPLRLTSSVAIYPLARFEVSPLQPKETISGGGLDLILGTQWKVLTASYRFEYHRSNGGIVKWRNNSFQFGLVFTLI